jgi:hypothetical protein
MLDLGWRVENRYTVAFGRYSSARKLAHRTRMLVGDRIDSVGLSGRVPELSILLESGKTIRTFQSYEGPPQWSIGFWDLSLIDVEPEWKRNDVSVWLGFKNKGYVRSYCFDERAFKPRGFLQKFGSGRRQAQR